jgi:hypothetical protein
MKTITVAKIVQLFEEDIGFLAGKVRNARARLSLPIAVSTCTDARSNLSSALSLSGHERRCGPRNIWWLRIVGSDALQSRKASERERRHRNAPRTDSPKPVDRRLYTRRWAVLFVVS